MRSLWHQSTGFYRPRQPTASPVFALLERFFAEFAAAYAECYAARYGPWRRVIATAVRDFLKCGDLKEGFARVRCPSCGHNLFVAFSCRRRCICPSCHQKHTLLTGNHIAEEVCSPVPHRQFVFTIPRNLRPYFRQNRKLLGELPRLAWETVHEVYTACLPKGGAVPGMVTVLQTFGELVHWNPHVHALATDGAFAADGAFLSLPEIPADPFALLWREKVFALLRREGCINGRVVWVMRSWKHTGFSVDRSVRVHGADQAAVDKIMQYMVRCPFSLERFVRVTPDGKVFYRTENAECRPFAFEGRVDTKAHTVRRNFELFAPLDFIAEITQHIPDRGEHLIRYYGWYANKARGIRAKSSQESAERMTGVPPVLPALTAETAVVPAVVGKPVQRRRSMRWAEMIKRVYATDPLVCPKCGGQMKIIAFLEKRDQAAEIEKILRQCGLWIETAARAPPPRAPPAHPAPVQMELLYVADGEDRPYDATA